MTTVSINAAAPDVTSLPAEVEPREPNASRPRPWVPAALTTLAGCLAVGLLLLLWQGLSLRDRGTTGASSVPFRQAPDFMLGLFDGSSFTLSDELGRGRPVVLNFWASWCIPCEDEAPVLQAGWERSRSWATFLGVDVQDLDEDARAFLRRHRITYPNGSEGSGPISVAYGMRGVPETYFIGADGRIVRKWNGPLSTAGLDQFLGEMRRASPGR